MNSNIVFNIFISKYQRPSFHTNIFFFFTKNHEQEKKTGEKRKYMNSY